MSEPEANELADLLAPFWTAPRAQEALGVTAEQLEEARAAHRVIGVVARDDEIAHYPVFQFEEAADGRTRVKPGLVAFMEAVGVVDGWTIGVLCMTPLDELRSLTPVDWLRQKGDPHWLETIGRRIRAEWR